jgi:outer membrane murein-binding lipoprotein Lpp
MLSSAVVLLVTVLAVVISTLLNRKDHKRIMTQLDDLNTAVAAISTDLGTLSGDVTTVLADFSAAEATIAAGGTADLTAIAATIAALDTSVQAALPVSSPVPPVAA